MNMRRILAVLVVVGCSGLVAPAALADKPAAGQAMAGVGVTRLWLPELLVEIQGIAVVSG